VDGVDAERDQDMALARAGRPDQAQILPGGDPFQGREVVQGRAGDGARGPVQLIEGLDDGERGGLHPGPGVGRLAGGDLGIDQGPQQFLGRPPLGLRGDEQLGGELPHRGELEPPEPGAEQAELRETIDPVTDRDTLVLRDLLTEAERALAKARATVVDLAQQQAEYTSERCRVQADLDRYRRMCDAGERLASIEFTVCPRCMQSLTQRRVAGGCCRVCLQPDPVTAAGIEDTDSYEARQLMDQLAEMDGQLQAVSGQIAAVTQAVADREQLVKILSADLDARTAARITPRLQAFSDAVQRLATSRARQQQLELVLRQWDRADDIGAAAERLRAERRRTRSALTSAQASLNARREEILASLNEEFQETVTALGVPGVETAAIHPTKYLPLLNDRPFATFSSGGGIITAVQVAYWASLLAVALRHSDTSYPALLVIDSPRLALNEQEALPAALYRRLVTQADASRGQVQFIIADNELPADYRRDYDEIDFTYNSPTVSTIRHPGPTAVEPITRS